MQEEEYQKLALRSILKERKPIGFYLKANWIFSTIIEKLGLTIMMGLAVWKLIDFFI